MLAPAFRTAVAELLAGYPSIWKPYHSAASSSVAVCARLSVVRACPDGGVVFDRAGVIVAAPVVGWHPSLCGRNGLVWGLARRPAARMWLRVPVCGPWCRRKPRLVGLRPSRVQLIRRPNSCAGVQTRGLGVSKRGPPEQHGVRQHRVYDGGGSARE